MVLVVYCTRYYLYQRVNNLELEVEATCRFKIAAKLVVTAGSISFRSVPFPATVSDNQK
jgi:hypothetical protein